MPRFDMPDQAILAEAAMPLSDAAFARICRSTPGEARDLAARLQPAERAQLALFCNGRAHLREVGRAIARACDEEDLVREGGHAGRVLFIQVKAGPDRVEIPKISLKRITLAH